MKNICIACAILFFLALSACGAKAKQLHANTGGPVFKIQGSAFTSLDDLFLKANETCDEQGYSVITARDVGDGEDADRAQLVVQCKGSARAVK